LIIDAVICVNTIAIIKGYHKCTISYYIKVERKRIKDFIYLLYFNSLKKKQ